MADSCTNPAHKGHRRYIGGKLDGQVAHLIYADPSDYPQTMSTMLQDGQRSHYEIDYDLSVGTEAVYRCVQVSREMGPANV